MSDDKSNFAPQLSRKQGVSLLPSVDDTFEDDNNSRERLIFAVDRFSTSISKLINVIKENNRSSQVSDNKIKDLKDECNRLNLELEESKLREVKLEKDNVKIAGKIDKAMGNIKFVISKLDADSVEQ